MVIATPAKTHYLALRSDRALPIHYEVVPFTDWTGLNEGEYLDIDWDFFACRDYPADTIQDRVEAFLQRGFRTVPEQVYVCYSPDYSHSSRDQFQHFVSDLAQILKAESAEVWPRPTVPALKPFYRKPILSPLFRWARHAYHSAGLELRKRGVY